MAWTVALCAYPPRIRRRYRDEMIETARDHWHHLRSETGHRALPLFVLWFAADLLRELLRRATPRTRFAATAPRPPMAQPDAPPPHRRLHVESVVQDVRFAIRSLRRRPTFVAGTLLTLALGIGATTTVFAIADAVIGQPLPYPEAERVVGIWQTFPEWRGDGTLDQWWDRVYLAYSNYEALQDETDVFDSVALFRNNATNFRIADDLEAPQLRVGDATSGLQDVLGLPMTLGRWILPSEEGPSAERVMVLSERVWRARFDADPEIVGRSIVVDEGPWQPERVEFTIVGVAPDAFQIVDTLNWGAPHGFSLWREPQTAASELWIPIGVLRQDDSQEYEGVARLAPGVTTAQALDRATVTVRGDLPPEKRGARLARRRQMEGSGLQSQIALLAAPSLLLLLIACGNIATLLLGEAPGRQHEIATRLAIGAPRGRIYRQLLTESALLGVIGSVLGAVAAAAAVGALAALAPPNAPLHAASVNGLVLAFASAIGIASGLLFGIVPAVALGRSRMSLARTGGVTSRSTGGSRLQRSVLAGEIAFTVALIVLGGLLVQTFANLRSTDVGFEPNNLTVFRVGIPPSSSRFAAPAPAFEELLNGIAGIPAVESVSGGVSAPPFAGGGSNHVRVRIAGSDEPLRTTLRSVLPGYHATLRMRLLSGRFLRDADRLDINPGAVISRAMAERYWPDREAVGAELEYEDKRITVVGVVEDVPLFGLGEIPNPTLYLQLEPASSRNTAWIVVRGEPREGFFDALRRAALSVDPGAQIGTPQQLSSLVAATTMDEQFHALMAVPFGVMAVMLALVGIAGVAARTIAQRYREFGIRTALGARPQLLIRMICRETVITSAIGITVGMIVAGVLARALGSFLHGVHFWDTSTFMGTALVLFLLSFAAGYVPALRLRKLDPARILRD